MNLKLFALFVNFSIVICISFGQPDSYYFQNDNKNKPISYKVRYLYNKGKCELINSSQRNGFFKVNLSPDIYIVKQFNKDFDIAKKGIIEYKTRIDTSTENIFYLQDIKKLILDDKDSYNYTPKDSTEFIYSPKYKKLLRLVLDSKIKLYDDQLIVNEIKNNSLEYYHLEYTTTYGVSYLNPAGGSNLHSYVSKPKYVEDIPNIDRIKEWIYPEIVKSSNYYLLTDSVLHEIKRTSDWKHYISFDKKIESLSNLLFKKRNSDFLFMTIYSNIDNKMNLFPFFDSIDIKLKNNKHVKGKGYVLPNDYEGLCTNGLVIINDGNNFQIYNTDSINYVLFNNRKYLPIVDSWKNKPILAYEWNYNDKNYLIADIVINEKNFLNYSLIYDFRILELKKNKWKWITDNDIINAFKYLEDK